MELISCGKNTLLHTFPDLKNEASFEHDKGAKVDFSFFHNNKFLIECVKNKGLVFLQAKKNSEGKSTFEKLKKVNIENLCCVGAPKKGFQDFAIGLATGDIKLLHYMTNKTSKRFSPDQPNNAVNYIDFSNCDESMLSVYENGNISVFGLTSFVKCESINIDKYATLAKFHPTKRFHISIASYSGNVTLYDSSFKKVIFQAKNSHDAPCRDLLIPLECPDRLISVGYDKVINIFDTRKKDTTYKISSHCPISTVSATNCGTFFCIGNLKGDLIAYDMRILRTPLMTVRAHDEAINRVAFLPNSTGAVVDTSFMKKSVLLDSTVDVQQNMHDKSFSNASMIDLVLNHNRRQSDFIEEDCSRASTGSRLSTTTTDTRMSGNFNTKKIAGMFNDFLNPNVSSNSSSNDNCVDDIEDNLAANLSNINLDRLGKRQSCPERSNSVKSSKSGKRNLTDIHEENIQSVSLDMPEKENTAKNFQNHKNQEFVFTPKLSLSQMSTPISENLEQSGKDKSDYSVEKIVVEDSSRSSSVLAAHPCNCASNDQNTKLILESLNSLHEKMDANKKSVGLMAYDMEVQKFALNRFIWNMTEKILERIRVCDQALALLITDEPVVRAGMQAQEEKQVLLDTLNEIVKKYGPFDI